jgi:hypothetical protein
VIDYGDGMDEQEHQRVSLNKKRKHAWGTKHVDGMQGGIRDDFLVSRIMNSCL